MNYKPHVTPPSFQNCLERKALRHGAYIAELGGIDVYLDREVYDRRVAFPENIEKPILVYTKYTVRP